MIGETEVRIMNHQEKANYHQSSEEYLKDMQTREVFGSALAELVLKQPEEPLEFLIKFL